MATFLTEDEFQQRYGSQTAPLTLSEDEFQSRYGGSDEGFLSSAYKNVMGGVGKVFGAFSYPLNALSRTVARAQGLPVSDEATMGSMLSGALGPGEEFTREHPLAAGLAKGGLEETGNLIAAGPLVAAGTASMPVGLARVMTGLFAAGAVGEAKHLHDAWKSGDQEEVGKALAGVGGFAGGGYLQHRLNQMRRPPAPVQGPIEAQGPRGPQGEWTTPPAVEGEGFMMKEPPFGQAPSAIPTAPLNAIPRSEISTEAPRDAVYNYAIEAFRNLRTRPPGQDRQVRQHFSDSTEGRIEAPASFYGPDGKLRDLSDAEIHQLWEQVAQTYPEKYPTGYDSMIKSQDVPPEIAPETLGAEMGILKGKRPATQQEIAEAVNSQKGSIYKQYVEKWRGEQMEMQPPPSEILAAPTRGVDERPIEAGEQLPPGAEEFNPPEPTTPIPKLGASRLAIPDDLKTMSDLPPNIQAHINEARAKPEYQKIQAWSETVVNAVQDVAGSVVPELANPTAYLSKYTGGAYDPQNLGANWPAWYENDPALSKWMDIKDLIDPKWNSFFLNLWTNAIDRNPLQYGKEAFARLTGRNPAKTLSTHVADNIIDTILHEIAHNVPDPDVHGPLWKATYDKLKASPVIAEAIKPYREALLADNNIPFVREIMRTLIQDGHKLEKLVGSKYAEATGPLASKVSDAFTEARGDIAAEKAGGADLMTEPEAFRRKALVEQQKLAIGEQKNPFAYDITKGKMGAARMNPPPPPSGGGKGPEGEPEPGRGPITTSDVLNVPRSLMTAADVSFVFRQAVIPTIRHPKIAWGALKESLGAFKSGEEANRLMQKLATSPEFNTNHYEGVHWTKHDGATPEEAFYGSRVIREWFKNLDKVIPGASKANLVEASERSFTYFLNKMRQEVHNYNRGELLKLGFEEGHLARDSETGKDYWVAGANDEVFNKAASWANIVTGRGEYPKGPGYVREVLRSSQGLLNAIMFSPRMMIARIAALNPKTYWDYFRTAQASSGSTTKALQATALGPVLDMATFLGVGATVAAVVAGVTGGTVEKDPRSSDFGKIKIGNTRFDVWGGFQPFVRTAAQLLTSQRKTKYGTVQGTTPGDVAGSFLRGRLAPVPALTIDALMGKDITGQSFWGPTMDIAKGRTPATAESLTDAAKTVGSQVGSNLFPMAYTDIIKAYQEDPWVGIASILPSLMGMGVSTHERLPSASVQKEFYSAGVSPPVNLSSIRLGENWEGKPVSYKMTFEEAKHLQESTDPQIYRTLEKVIQSPQYQQLSPKLKQILLGAAVRQMNALRSAQGKAMIPPPQIRSSLMEGFADFQSNPEETPASPQP